MSFTKSRRTATRSPRHCLCCTGMRLLLIRWTYDEHLSYPGLTSFVQCSTNSARYRESAIPRYRSESSSVFPWYDSPLNAIPNIDPFSGYAIWNLIELFANMDLAHLSSIVDNEVLPSLQTISWDGSTENLGNLTAGAPLSYHPLQFCLKRN